MNVFTSRMIREAEFMELLDLLTWNGVFGFEEYLGPRGSYDIAKSKKLPFPPSPLKL